jgi:acyl carrier protein
VEARERYDEIMRFLLKRAADLIGEAEARQPLSATAPLREIGIDSIHLINLIVQIEQRYEVFFEDDEMTSQRFQTIADIAALLLQKIGFPMFR